MHDSAGGNRSVGKKCYRATKATRDHLDSGRGREQYSQASAVAEKFGWSRLGTSFPLFQSASLASKIHQ